MTVVPNSGAAGGGDHPEPANFNEAHQEDPKIAVQPGPTINATSSSSSTLMEVERDHKNTESSRPIVFLDITLGGNAAGTLEIELFSDIVPRTAENFRCLCTGERGVGRVYGRGLHYMNCAFLRVCPRTFCQTGDIVEHNGTAGESIYGEYFADENFELKHERGSLSMANCGRKDSNGSQFFICFDRLPDLDGKYVVFGKVLPHTLETLEAIRDTGSEVGHTSEPAVISMCGQLA
ncbi:unnamed protein product [Amoebophrya sp. A25]|nr:unnamed protein product [Amoebophrya sp. A25]|eukprot:GSA25T00023825001.1